MPNIRFIMGVWCGSKTWSNGCVFDLFNVCESSWLNLLCLRRNFNVVDCLVCMHNVMLGLCKRKSVSICGMWTVWVMPMPRSFHTPSTAEHRPCSFIYFDSSTFDGKWKKEKKNNNNTRNGSDIHAHAKSIPHCIQHFRKEIDKMIHNYVYPVLFQTTSLCSILVMLLSSFSLFCRLSALPFPSFRPQWHHLHIQFFVYLQILFDFFLRLFIRIHLT